MLIPCILPFLYYCFIISILPQFRERANAGLAEVQNPRNRHCRPGDFINNKGICFKWFFYKIYWKSMISAQRRRNSSSSFTPFVSCAAAAIGSHFCTYCFAVSLFLQKIYWKSMISAQRRRNSSSSFTPFVSCAAAAIGSHFCTYCFAVSLFLQKRFRYRSAVF